MTYAAPLPAAEQVHLCRLAQEGDLVARNRLVETMMRLVMWRAKVIGRISPSTPTEDFIGEGVLGLLHAIEKFNPLKGSFASYACRWVDQAIRSAAWRDRDVGRGALKHTRAMREVQEAVASGSTWEVAVIQTALAHKTRAATLSASIATLRRLSHLPLDAPTFDGGPVLNETIADDGVGIDTQLDAERATAAVQLAVSRLRPTLDARQLKVLDSRILADDEDMVTLRELGRMYGRSGEWVRLAERDLLQRLRMAIQRDHRVVPRPSVADYKRRWYARRKQLGLCGCGEMARPGKATCGGHRQSAAYKSVWREKCLLRGVCPSHPERAASVGATRCVECVQKRRTKAAARRAEWKEARLCATCGKRPPAEGVARCDDCRVRRALIRQKAA